DPTSGLHQGQRSIDTAQTGRTHDRILLRSDQINFVLAQKGSSTHDNATLAMCFSSIVMSSVIGCASVSGRIPFGSIFSKTQMARSRWYSMFAAKAMIEANFGPTIWSKPNAASS
ncbi:MAG: hypothetical protein RIM72_03360, partial [Alphaproteobacteria bacterium]